MVTAHAVHAGAAGHYADCLLQTAGRTGVQRLGGTVSHLSIKNQPVPGILFGRLPRLPTYRGVVLPWERRPRREGGLPGLIAARAPLFIHLLYKRFGVVRFLERVAGGMKRNCNQDAGKNNADKGDHYGEDF